MRQVCPTDCIEKIKGVRLEVWIVAKREPVFLALLLQVLPGHGSCLRVILSELHFEKSVKHEEAGRHNDQQEDQ